MEKSALTKSMSKKGCTPVNSTGKGFFGRLKSEFFYNQYWLGVSIRNLLSHSIYI